MYRFRIKENDTVKATVCSKKTGKLLASLYDSGFTTISEVENNLIRKIPFFDGKEISISITNLEKEENKSYTKKVNL